MNHLELTRIFPEPQESIFSDPLLLDRHRIIHSTSFRRLGYKTQVFLPLEADHFRTRLTHSLEVAHIAILLTGKFDGHRLLAEVISLAHDLGHGPFGHSSERILNKLLSSVGGFEHNHQSIRVVEYLEGAYPWFRGLNLTRATLEGMAVHNTPYDQPDRLDSEGHLEGQLANWSDRIAYNSGDLEDALGADFITQSDLETLSLFRKSRAEIPNELMEKPLHAVRRIILESIQHILMESLEADSITGKLVVTMKGQELNDLKEVEAFLLHHVYLSDRLKRTAGVVQEMISRVFNRYLDNPELLPQRFLVRKNEFPMERIIGDYISGMTDRFCLKTYRQMFGSDDTLLSGIDPVVGLGSS
jgi:dGTPase